jgi:hypothetical protein
MVGQCPEDTHRYSARAHFGADQELHNTLEEEMPSPWSPPPYQLAPNATQMETIAVHSPGSIRND